MTRPGQGTRPNVLEIISDQHMADCMGAEGHPQAITPNMDRLAENGVRFRHAYTQNPICTPSRVSVLSGQYCHNHGYYGLSGPTPPNLPSFLGHFRAHGYQTAGIGKLHLPDDPVNWLLHDNALDVFKEAIFSATGRPYDSPYFDYVAALGLTALDDSRGLPEFPGRAHWEGRPSNVPFEHSIEGWCIKEAMRFIDGCGDQPFCMQVSLPRPHAPYTPAREFWEMYPDDIELPASFFTEPALRPPHFQQTVERNKADTGLIEPRGFQHVTRRRWRGYLACTSQVDHCVGMLVHYLEQVGKTEDTIVVYHSDHGAYTGTYGIPEKAPGICSERVCRIPYIWYVPGVTHPGGASKALVENVDIASTLTALCGLPPMSTVDGHDITPLLNGQCEAVREVAVTENPWSKSLRWKEWRFVHYQPKMFAGQDVGELYHIGDDPDELHNLYYEPEYQKTVEQCRRRLLEWLIGTTRNRTTWPAVARTSDLRTLYETAGDDREANGSGPELRLRRGELNYI